MFGFNANNNQYKIIAKKAFANANSLGDEVRHAMSNLAGMPGASADIIMTASNAATALYEYTALLCRDKLIKEISNQYEFEKQDNLMVEAFAETLMIPAIALHKIITAHDSPEDWENILYQIPIFGVNIDYYLEQANKIIDEMEI